ncbi:MAG TPA: glycosyltransferase family 4 protein [Patescibacteria group bacterium]|nr:glycosyltransferase family 4 protein [Patescibacteria group bacterium]
MKKHIKKIAIVSDAVYPYNKGGKEIRIYEVSKRLAALGYDVNIYCMKWWKGEATKQENGVTLHAISPRLKLYSGSRRSISQAIAFSLNCLKMMNIQFDVIDVDHMPHLVLFPLRFVTTIRRKKLIVTWNEVWGPTYWRKYLGVAGFFAYFVEKVSSALPDKIISVSEHTTSQLKTQLKFRRSISTIPNGIDLKKIKNVVADEVSSDVIFAGRLLSHKNVNVLINAISLLVKKYPQIKCLIVGEGPEKFSLQLQTKKLGLVGNIVFLDFCDDHDRLFSLMKSSKVFVLPSNREGFGIVAIEANACGIPVITVDEYDNAAKDLISNGRNGFVCNLNANEIAENISKVLSEKIDFNTDYKIEEYDWDNVAARVAASYNL